MAYDFLNTTTYTKPLQMQEDLMAQMMSQQHQQSSDFNDLEEIQGDEQDLVEIMAQEELEEQQEQQDDRFSYETEEDNDLSDSTDQLIASMLLDEREPDAAGSMGSVGTYHTPATMPNTDDIRRRDKKPRIWFPQEEEEENKQYGGYGKKKKKSKYQFGGNTLYATDEMAQRVGLNNPTYNSAILSLRGTNTIRGLDNNQPVAVTDGRKYKILKGPKDTARFSGPVYEQRLNS